jgi:hypothetical protein
LILILQPGLPAASAGLVKQVIDEFGRGIDSEFLGPEFCVRQIMGARIALGEDHIGIDFLCLLQSPSRHADGVLGKGPPYTPTCAAA